MRITIAGLCLVIASIASAIYSLHISSLELLSLSVVALLIVWKSYSDVKAYRGALGSVEVVRKLSRGYAEEGDVVEVSIEARNNSHTHIHRIEVEDLLPELASPLDPPIAGASLPPGYSLRLSYRLELRSPGRYEFSRAFVRLKDPLGVFAEELAIDLPGFLVAAPKPMAFREVLEIASRSPGVWLRGQSLGGLYDFYGVRDYQYGDDARKILWRVYARTGRLVVREDLSESMGRVVVIIDIPASSWRVGRPPRTLAEDLARISRGVIEALVRSYNAVDAVICEEYAARVVRGIWGYNREAVYSLYTNLKPYAGCESSYILYNSLKYLEVGPAGMAIVVTSPLGLAESDPEALVEAVGGIGKLVYILIYSPQWAETGALKDLLEASIPALNSIGWRVVAVPSPAG